MSDYKTLLAKLADRDSGWYAAERGEPRDGSKSVDWLNGWENWAALEELDRLRAQLAQAQQDLHEAEKRTLGMEELQDQFDRMETQLAQAQQDLDDARNGWESAVEAVREADASFGYALAMRVMQSDLYAQLDDRERGECDALSRGCAQRGAAMPMDKETEKQALEAYEHWCTSPMEGVDADMSTPAIARRAYLAGYAEAHGHASGQQGVEGFEPVNTAPRDGSPFLGTWIGASGRKFGWIEYDLFRERFVHFKTGNSWCQIDGWHPLAASPQITMPAAQPNGYVKYEDARRAVALTIRSMTSAAPDKWPTADELMEAWDKVIVAQRPKVPVTVQAAYNEWLDRYLTDKEEGEKIEPMGIVIWIAACEWLAAQPTSTTE